MLSEKVEKALNVQINEELYSAYLYLAMAAHFESVNLLGIANWMRVQTQEEISHGMKIYNYIFERGGRVILEQIKTPTAEWSSPIHAFEEVFKHERHISNCIDELVNLSIAEKDHATNNMLQWFVAEQVEEESTADGILQKFKLAGDDGAGLFMIDQELAQRVFTPPAAAE